MIHISLKLRTNGLAAAIGCLSWIDWGRRFNWSGDRGLDWGRRDTQIFQGIVEHDTIHHVNQTIASFNIGRDNLGHVASRVATLPAKT